MQKKRHSVLEQVVNLSIGYTVAVFTQTIMFPMFGIYASVGDNMIIAGVFTVISFFRGYAVRRLFNWLQLREVLR